MSDQNQPNLEAESTLAAEEVEVKPLIRQPENLFLVPAPRPTMVGAEKIRYDFNSGCRVELPPLQDGKKW